MEFNSLNILVFFLFINACCLVVSNSFVIPWTVAHQAPLSVEFSRQEYWSGLPFSSPGDLPDPEIKPTSLKSRALAGGFFSTSYIWEPANAKGLN